MQQRHSWDHEGAVAGQKISRLLWKLKIYYCVYKKPRLNLTLIYMNSSHNLATYFLAGPF